MFCLNFSSAGEGPFIAGKAKNVHQRCTFLGAGGSGVWDMAPPLLGNLGTKFSETSFPLPPARALRFLHSYRERDILVRGSHSLIQRPVFTQICRPYIHSFPCGMWESHQITTWVFLESTSLMLVNLKAVAGVKKCCFRQEILPVTAW